MKTKMNTLLLLALLAACTPKSEKAEQQEVTATQEAVAEAMPETEDAIVSAYMTLKDALVKSDADLAKKSAEALHHLVMESEAQKALADACMELVQGADLAAQRKAFQTLTTEFIAYAKAADTGSKLYVQYCPMAFDNTGGNWVSTSSEIRNPYFGDMMLKCGRIEEEI